MSKFCGPTENTVLIIENDEVFALELIDTLANNGVPAVFALTWEAGLRAIERIAPALILLNQHLERFDPIIHLRKLRAITASPIIVLSDQRSEADRIVALELGADNVLAKPVSTREIAARVRAYLRLRPSSLDVTADRTWRIAPRERRLYRPDGTPVALTTAEFFLLLCLATSPGVPVTRDALSSFVLQRDFRIEDRALDNLIYQVRQKIRDAGGGEVIFSARNRGYYFVDFPFCVSAE